MMSFFELTGINLFIILSFMSVMFLLAYRWNNLSVVDIAWTLCFPLQAIIGFSLGKGDLLKNGVLLLLIILWSSRLAFYLILRFDKNVEDPRYTRVMEYFQFKMFGMFIFQGVTTFFLSIPFMIFFSFSKGPWSVLEMTGIIIWSIGLVGESIADMQLRKFKQLEKGSLKVCDVGLWRYSRHPNYFFEWLVWVGFFFLILPTHFGWSAFISAGVMYYFLRYYSGVPLSEIQAIASKGDAYKQYQTKTSIFFPWFPKDI
jgi:steroid 5-alpha reductase family enzyme